jgi:RimJ/RimL family protein N-acetyltransferase
MFPDLTRDDVFFYETRRLWLRWPRAADAPALQRIAAHENVATMTATWPHPLPDGEAEKRIFRMRKGNAEGAGLGLAIVLKTAPGKLIGSVGGGFGEGSDDLGFGYMLAPEQWNRGLMSEAVRAYADIVFSLTAAKGMWALVMAKNPASRRVLEKAGFAHVGAREENFTARNGVVACEHFGLTRAAWSEKTPLLSSNWHQPVATSPSAAAIEGSKQGGGA